MGISLGKRDDDWGAEIEQGCAAGANDRDVPLIIQMLGVIVLEDTER